MLICLRTCREVRLVPRQVELIILGLDRVSIDGHVFAERCFEPDDLGVAGTAPRDATLVLLSRVFFLEAHDSTRPCAFDSFSMAAICGCFLTS